jgi:hypothetical protein
MNGVNQNSPMELSFDVVGAEDNIPQEFVKPR